MRFKYLEDYEKMQKLEKMIGKPLDKLDYESIPKNFESVRDLSRDLDELEEFIKKCNFLKIDYDDRRLFRTTFLLLIHFLRKQKINS